MEYLNRIVVEPVVLLFWHLILNIALNIHRKMLVQSALEMPVSMFETVIVQYQTLFHPYQKVQLEQQNHEKSASIYLYLFIIHIFRVYKNCAE